MSNEWLQLLRFRKNVFKQISFWAEVFQVGMCGPIIAILFSGFILRVNYFRAAAFPETVYNFSIGNLLSRHVFFDISVEIYPVCFFLPLCHLSCLMCHLSRIVEQVTCDIYVFTSAICHLPPVNHNLSCNTRVLDVQN